MIRPMMSLAVVIKGPVASAGSIFLLSRARGMKVPKSAANTITHIREKPTVTLRFMPNPNKKVVTKIITEHIRPFKSPTRNSFASCPVIFEVDRLEAARPCTTMAED
jgi:hypothetical protein